MSNPLPEQGQRVVIIMNEETTSIATLEHDDGGDYWLTQPGRERIAVGQARWLPLSEAKQATQVSRMTAPPGMSHLRGITEPTAEGES